MEIKIISEEMVFAGMKEKWNGLLKESAGDTVFLTWEWAHSWWEEYREGKSLMLITAQEEGKLVGIAPLYATRARFFGLRPLTHAEFLCSVGPCSEYLDFIIVKGREKEILYALLDKLFDSKSLEWDALNLMSLKENSPNLVWLKKYQEEKGFPYEIYARRESPYIPLPMTMEELYAGLSRKQRYNSKLYKKVLLENHDVSFHVVKERAELENAFNSFVQLHQRRREDKEEGGSFNDSRREYMQFHRKIASLFFQNGWLYLVFLKADDKPIAVQYSFIYNNVMSCFQVGFDPDWANYRVGTVLQLMVLHDIIDKKIAEFDFLRGTEEYKYRWTKITRASVDLVLWRSVFVHKEITVEKAIRKTFKNLLPLPFAERVYNQMFVRDK